MQQPFSHAAVIGAGTMGHGIAQVLAVSGRSVWLIDQSPEVLERAQANIAASLGVAVQKNKLSAEQREAALGRLRTTLSLGEGCQAAQLVIEAVPEDMALKGRVLAAADEAAPEGAALASNTSSMSITALAAKTRRPGRFVGLHFFNPVPVMELLEVVVGERTEEGLVEEARALASSLGKTPVVIRDAPGFATSRLGIALAMEAIRMVETGVASAQDIDKAMELGYRFPMGPLKLTDLVGLDVRLNIAEHLYAELGTDTFKPPQLLKRLVRAGKLGKKSGEGFYKW